MGDAPEARRKLRSAVSRADGPGALGALSAGPWDDVLQLAGDGILLALAQEIDDASELAGSCAAKLRGRGWEGDDILADQLSVTLGKATDLNLRCLSVDLEELSDVLEGDSTFGPGGIDLVTGQVWPGSSLEYVEETGEELPDFEDPERWLYVGGEGSREGISRHAGLHLDGHRHRPGRPAVYRHFGPRGLSAVQRRH